MVARLLGGALLLLAVQGAAENEVMALQPQQTGSRIAIVGDQLVWWNRDRLEMWNLATRRLDARMSPTVHASALGIVAGEIIAVGGDPAMRFPWLTRFQRFHPDHVPAEHGYFFSGADRVVDAGAGEFWVSELPPGLVRYRLGERVERISSLEWRMNQALTFTAAAEPNAALFYESGAIVRLGREGATRFAVTHDIANPRHLAGGPRMNTAWVTARDSLCLVELENTRARVVWRKRFAGEAYHLARAGDLAALLTVEARAGAWHVVKIAAIDSRGTVLWSRDLRPPRLTEAWVAGSSQHVGVALGEKLLVWRAADGNVVVPVPP
jgi:hypothetical protein